MHILVHILSRHKWTLTKVNVSVTICIGLLKLSLSHIALLDLICWLLVLGILIDDTSTEQLIAYRANLWASRYLIHLIVAI